MTDANKYRHRPHPKTWAQELYGNTEAAKLLWLAFSCAKWNLGPQLDLLLEKLSIIRSDGRGHTGAGIPPQIQLLEDADGNTLFHCAARHGHHEIIDRLLTHCRCHGRSVWYDYATSGQPLLETNHMGETPLELAERHGHRYAYSIMLLEIPDVLSPILVLTETPQIVTQPQYRSSHMRGFPTQPKRFRGEDQLLPVSKRPLQRRQSDRHHGRSTFAPPHQSRNRTIAEKRS
ncbi:hypothetical protein QBC43DRAFT_349699 [Cladorrhinum sp. PSN259]|nr:hypothetical protein QBC43DRAFT_349699 [Cladorrhinum sp. PSN259]